MQNLNSTNPTNDLETEIRERSIKAEDTAIFPPLESVTRPSLETPTAAYYLNREQQTLRCWAMKGNGPIQPIRINGRLHWSTNGIRKLLGV